MNIQSKINAVKSRIAQIETSDLFNEEEKEELVRANALELNHLAKQLPVNHHQSITATN